MKIIKKIRFINEDNDNNKGYKLSLTLLFEVIIIKIILWAIILEGSNFSNEN